MQHIKYLQHITLAIRFFLFSIFKIKTFKNVLTTDGALADHLKKKTGHLHLQMNIQCYPKCMKSSVTLFFTYDLISVTAHGPAETGYSSLIEKKKIVVSTMKGIGGVWHSRVQLCSSVMPVLYYTILKTMDKYCSYETWIQPSWSVSYRLKMSVNLCQNIKRYNGILGHGTLCGKCRYARLILRVVCVMVTCSTMQHWMKSSNATCPFLWRSNFSMSVP